MEIWKILTQSIKNLDIYGIPIRVNFKKQEIHKTNFGALLSSIIFIMIGFALYFYVQELFNKNSPIVITSEQYVRNPQRMDFDKVQQVLVMGFNNSTGATVYDPSVIQVSASISQLKKIYNQTTQGYQNFLQSTSLRVRPCSKQDIRVDSMQSYFNQLPLSNYFCFDDNQEVYIEGDYSGDVYSKVDVFFTQCKNSTYPGSVVCKPQDQIDKQTSNLFFLTYMIDKIIDPNNLGSPFSYQGVNLETQTSAQQSQQYTAFFENYYIQSDTGLITKQLNQLRDFLFVQSRSDNLYGKPGLIIQFTLRPYKNKQLFMQRRYMKLSDLLAQLGGIIKLLTLIGFAITYPFTRLHLNKEIINSIFDFEFKQDEIKKIQTEDNNLIEKSRIDVQQNLNKNLEEQFDQNQFKLTQNFQDLDSKFIQLTQLSEIDASKIQNKEIIPNQTFRKKETQYPFKKTKSHFKNQEGNKIMTESKQYQENFIKQSYFEKIRSILNPIKKKVSLSISDYIQFLNFGYSKIFKLKKLFILEGVNQVKNSLDIQNIIQKLQEIDKLKQILLNEEQLKLFEIIPRPTLNIQNEQNKTKKQDITNMQQEEKINNAYNSLIKVINQPFISKKDFKIIFLLDKQIYKSVNDPQQQQDINQLNNQSKIIFNNQDVNENRSINIQAEKFGKKTLDGFFEKDVPEEFIEKLDDSYFHNIKQINQKRQILF
ncbi:hypothetical protein ABPG74_004976 [Tetrahymena malaccensis]